MSIAVMTTAHRRPYYFEPVLASWAKAVGIGDVARFVVALGPSEKMAEQEALIERMRPRFGCPVEVRVQSPAAQAGPCSHRAVAEAVNGILAEDQDVDFVVATEEDILVSDDVLAYFQWAREKLAGDPRVLCVCAHNQLGSGWDVPHDDSAADQELVRLIPYYSAWCWGTWRDRWERVLEPTWDYEQNSGSLGFDSGYDWNIQTRVMPRGGFACAVPEASRSQNIGEHEGFYAKPDRYPETYSLSFRAHRDPGYRLG